MSFILDALKKSENDRQRQTGPALFEVRVAKPRSQYPMWAIVLLALLMVNLVVVGWLMLRRPAAAATPPATEANNAAQPPASQPVQSAPVQPPAQVAQMQMPVAVSPPPGYVPQTQMYQQPPPGYQTAPVGQAYAPPQGAPVYAPPQGAVGYAPPQGAYAPPQNAQGYAPPAANTGSYGYSTPPQPAQQAPPPAEPFASSSANAEDYAPATEPNGETTFGHVRRGLANGLMTYEEAAAKNSIPPLHMDLHVYAPDPRKRFVLVNSRRLTEGESLPEGVRVESITADGAILSYRGVQFMMERE